MGSRGGACRRQGTAPAAQALKAHPVEGGPWGNDLDMHEASFGLVSGQKRGADSRGD